MWRKRAKEGMERVCTFSYGWQGHSFHLVLENKKDKPFWVRKGMSDLAALFPTPTTRIQPKY